MLELSNLIHNYRCHFELTYSNTTDWTIHLWRSKYNADGTDVEIFQDQSPDLDYLISKCKVAYKDWLLENNGGY